MGSSKLKDVVPKFHIFIQTAIKNEKYIISSNRRLKSFSHIQCGQELFLRLTGGAVVDRTLNKLHVSSRNSVTSEYHF